MTPKKIELGKYPGNYRGQVLDNNDPLQYGRIKVNVHGIFDGIDSGDLPWAVPCMPLFVGAGSDQGSFCVPDVGTYVFVFFENQCFNQPVYFGEAIDATRGLPSERTTNYPNRRIWKTASGISIIIDDTSELVKIDTPSGAFVSIESDGTITISGDKVEINP